ncbi:chemotaxis response regulator protein-glutamate methylesterase [Oxobacter pfennigii]|uniref:Protein-glutamate methylesterase/protein-glutamine glutaminase n=1 Tax=Oxobacter pfennigii TaxID=36849 RepID=A0A0P8YC07_9CLOT|nr:chemotaxis response regulator protein-glutamate methylesterase [Oxobacter pfennigii]KPU44651.1 chemotaxis response regulator protein-glutamate methylesterase [Oxobacter pfennigii]
MSKIRVLVVDDSAFMRKIISDMLSSDKDIEVVDTARDGVWALEKLKTTKVDVVTMDVEMPRMNGLEALKEITGLYKIPVIMLSSLTSNGADTTFKALEFGAMDFVLKPSFSIGMNLDELKIELISKIKMCCKTTKKTAPEKIEAVSQNSQTSMKGNEIKGVCIAASTGGPKALSTVMKMFPQNFKLPILIVQHMPAGFTKAFAKRLDDNCPVSIKEAQAGERIEKGKAYIAPGGYHMVVEKDMTISLNEEPAMHGVRPCADKLFISAAENIGGKLIGIVLTGMGKDGTLGLKAIKDKGGICIAEHQSTCTIYGMPKNAIEKGVVHIIAPVHDVVGEVLKITRTGN